ncbi:hemolysin type calcium-binding protein [Aliiruegeria haliotis]|uniref:Hemolysin type calcium-binding protein n=1 Tax=Aliiruegeria haliotis TaxID=1280846 RepID=A0A2T0RR54_9RHOB|nr:calcium-binding protein [Aliiruegeria haliotis]PRY23676.1 hemolysin type calcium-binding protein [Aliiruegeria haliotis]
MALVRAAGAFRQDQFDLGATYNVRDHIFRYDDDPWTTWGRTYNDDWGIAFSAPDGAYVLSFVGQNLQMTDTALKGGEVTGVIYQYNGGSGWGDMWAIQNISSPGNKIFAAMRTQKLGDDIALAKDMFSGNDRFELGRHDDFALGYDGADRIKGNRGDDELSGGNGADRLQGDHGNDILRGGKGTDTLLGGSGKDKARGGAGNDQLEGGRGGDALFGEAGSDKLLGQNGNDLLEGGGGADILKGGGGRDLLHGGRGMDVLTGGSHADSFLFGKSSGRDRITDFRDNVDTIRLAADLWQGNLTVREVVDTFGAVKGDAVVLDFGKQELTIDGYDELAFLMNDIQIA